MSDRTALANRMEENSIGEPNSGCLLWTGAYFTKGYGCLTLPVKPWKNVRAHRAAWEVENGPIPDGMLVLHKCDTRGCIRPDHLWLGTNDENMADMAAKGRAVKGEQLHNAKLKESDIPQIRADCRRHEDIAADFGISDSVVWAIKHGLTWRHVP